MVHPESRVPAPVTGPASAGRKTPAVPTRSSTAQPGPPAAGTGDINGVLKSTNLASPELRLLLITLDAATASLDPDRECVIYVAARALARATGREHDGSIASRLPVADGVFDVVLGDRLVRPDCDATELLREALRLVRRGGSLVLVTDPRDFQSAPLPPQGPAHLAQRALAAAGIQGAHFASYGAASVAVVHRHGSVAQS